MCDHKELRPDIEILPQATEQVKGYVFFVGCNDRYEAAPSLKGGLRH